MMTQDKEQLVPWRVFLNGKYWGVLNGVSGEDVIVQVNEKLRHMKARVTTIKACRAQRRGDCGVVTK